MGPRRDFMDRAPRINELMNERLFTLAADARASRTTVRATGQLMYTLLERHRDLIRNCYLIYEL